MEEQEARYTEILHFLQRLGNRELLKPSNTLKPRAADALEERHISQQTMTKQKDMLSFRYLSLQRTTTMELFNSMSLQRDQELPISKELNICLQAMKTGGIICIYLPKKSEIWAFFQSHNFHKLLLCRVEG